MGEYPKWVTNKDGQRVIVQDAAQEKEAVGEKRPVKHEEKPVEKHPVEKEEDPEEFGLDEDLDEEDDELAKKHPVAKKKK